MNRTLLLGSMMGGVIIVFITTIFSFTPNSADPSSIPLLKEYTYKLVNKERQKNRPNTFLHNPLSRI